MIKGLRQARLADGLPRVLAQQAWVSALSEAVGAATEWILDFADASQLYTRLDTAPEAMLDVLAGNWKIDWYDTAMTVEQKRRTVKSALQVQRLMGTAKAVKLQVDAVYPGTKVEEWFEYGGVAGYFRLRLPVAQSGVSADDLQRLWCGVEQTKNLRSHLEGVALEGESHGALRLGAYTLAGVQVELWPELVNRVEVRGAVSTDGKSAVRQTVEVWPEGRWNT